MSTKTIRCTDCRAEFTDEEIEGFSRCPNCGTSGVPCAISQDTTIKINWHELRILTIWASNYAAKLEESNRRSVDSIIRELEKQRPSDWAPLTILGEIKELPSQLAKSGIKCGQVEMYQDGNRVFPPKHEDN